LAWTVGGGFASLKSESRKKYPPARTTPTMITTYSERADILIEVVCGGRDEEWWRENLLKVGGSLRWVTEYYKANPRLLGALFPPSAYLGSMPRVRGVYV